MGMVQSSFAPNVKHTPETKVQKGIFHGIYTYMGPYNGGV